jgi:hypothetical protein
MIVDVACTEANFCKQAIRLNLSIARSRLRKLRCEFSTRLLAQRPTSCFSEFRDRSLPPCTSPARRW